MRGCTHRYLEHAKHCCCTGEHRFWTLLKFFHASTNCVSCLCYMKIDPIVWNSNILNEQSRKPQRFEFWMQWSFVAGSNHAFCTVRTSLLSSSVLQRLGTRDLWDRASTNESSSCSHLFNRQRHCITVAYHIIIIGFKRWHLGSRNDQRIGKGLTFNSKGSINSLEN